MGENLTKQGYQLTTFDYGLAGAATGFGTRFICQPLDVLKIRLQLQTTPLKRRNEAKYRSLLQAIRLMFVEEGISCLWKGHNAGQILTITYSTVQFSTYEELHDVGKKLLPSDWPYSEHVLNVFCGGVAGFTATVVSFPFDVIRTHLVFQGNLKAYRGMMDASYQIYHKEGMGGFKKGMLAAIIQNTPMSGLTFCFKGIFRDLWLWFFSDHNIKPKASISTCGSVVTSLLAGICAKTVVYPFDLMKKRLQIQGFDTEKSWSKEMMKCSKLSDCFFKTIKTEGYSGLFKGLAPSVIKAGTFTAVYFTLYEQFCFLIAYIRR